MALVRYRIQVTGVTSCNMLTCPDRRGYVTDVEGIVHVTAQNVLAGFHRYRSGSLAIQILTGICLERKSLLPSPSMTGG
jgi:hypothetical protein